MKKTKFIAPIAIALSAIVLFSAFGGRRNTTPQVTNISLSLSIDFMNEAASRRCWFPHSAYGISCVGAMAKNAALGIRPFKSDFDVFSPFIVRNIFYGTIRIVNADNTSSVLFESNLASLSLNNINGCSIVVSIPSNVRCRVIVQTLEPCYENSVNQPCYRNGVVRSAWGADVTVPAGRTSANIDLTENALINSGLC